MAKIYHVLTLAVFILVSTLIKAQPCAFSSFSYSGIITQSIPGSNVVTPAITMGKYLLVNVYQGRSYTFSMCGLAGQFDAVMTIYQESTGTLIGFDDDFCGGGLGSASLSQVSFISPVTGYVRVVLTQYPCLISSNSCAVRIIDNSPATAPGISCPANIIAPATLNCGANVTFPLATATGNPIPTITYSRASGSFFPVGTTNITATASNSVNPNATCSFTVTVTGDVDTDGDGSPNICDSDDDNDGILDVNDNCPLVSNVSQLDTDNDGTGNACDADDDNDGIADANDNCPLVANASQLDTDNDGLGNGCDPDDDNDGIPDGPDCAPLDATKWQQAFLYIDNDNDNYTNGQQTVCYGASIPTGFKANSLGTDCNDNNIAINPGATEVCNDIDDDCDGIVDDGFINTVVTCPFTGTVTKNLQEGCTYTVNGNEFNATVTQNCGPLGYTLTGATTGTGTSLAGVQFNTGTTTVTWSATNANDQSFTCSFNVYVVPATPAIVCPQNIIAPATNGQCGSVVNYTTPTLPTLCTNNDNLPPTTQTFNYTGQIVDWVVPSGVTSVIIEGMGAQGGDNITLNGLGGKGAIMKGTFNVTPGQTLKIVVGQRGFNNTGGGGNAVNGAGGGGGGSFIWLNSSSTPMLVAGGGGGSCLINNGSPHYHGKDASVGNNGTGSRSHDIFSNAPGGVNGNSGPDVCGGKGWYAVLLNPSGVTTTQYAYGADGGYGGGGAAGKSGPSCNYLHVAGGGGGYSGGGSGGTCYYHGGGGGGSFNSGADQVNSVGNTGNGQVTITYGSASTSVTQTSGLPSGSNFAVGTTTNTFKITDAFGQTSNCSFTVTVNDEQAPTIIQPNNITVANTIGQCSASVNFSASASDNCSVTSLKYYLNYNTANQEEISFPKTFAVGSYVVTVVAKDAANNTSTKTFTITVNDTEKPTFIWPSNQNVTLNANCQLIVPNLIAELIGNDNCGTVTFMQSPIASTSLPSSHNQTHNVVITATDANGNTQTCTVVLTGKDLTKPTFTCPNNQNVNLNATCQLLVPNLIAELTGSDNCGAVTFTQSPVAGASLVSSHNQTHNVVITANDGNGNTQTCTVVLTGKDITPPVINCVENITKSNDPGICGAIINYVSPANSDNCGCVAPTGINGYTFLGIYNGHKYFRSSLGLSWTNAKAIANGLGGHLATINSSGEQLFLQGATTEPSWIGFTDEANEGIFVWVTGEPVTYTNWLTPGEPNNYAGNENYAVLNGHGTYWNDLSNSWPGQFIVEFECETNTGGVIVTQTGGLPSGSTFTVGLTTNTFLATDAAGNTSTCSFTVTVNDTEKPNVTAGTIESCYKTVALAEAAALATTTYGDNCTPNAQLNVNVATVGTCSAVITVTVTDAASNSKSVTYNTRIDNTAPVLGLTPASLTVNCQSVPAVPAVTASDNCDGNVNVTFTPISTQGGNPAQSNYYNYTITRKWYATDGCGNTVEHIQTITVQDITKPMITCPADKLSVPFDFGQLYATIAIGTATATDNCAANANIAIAGTRSDNVVISNQQYPLGQTTVAWSATDPSDNSDGCTQTITVRKRNTAVTYTGDMTDNKICVQYSDIINLQAKLTDNEGLAMPNNISGRTITFQLLSGTTVLRSKTATTNANGVAVDTFKVEQAPGLYSVKTIFAGDSYFNGSNDQDNCEVKQEDAILEYNGSQYFTTSSATTLTGSITLATSINDIDDGSDKRGDIRKAKVTFRDGGPAGNVLGSANLPVGLVTPGVLTNGLSATAQNNITLNSNDASSGGKIYQVWVGASDHYTGADAGPTPVTLALPGLEFVTGGGHLVVTNSAGTYSGTVNSKMNFGFTMKWNKSGKNLQGNINIVFRKWQLYNGVWQWRVYQAKSNAINSMAVVEVGSNGQPVTATNPAMFRKAIINTKANLKDVTDPLNNIDLGGNHNLTLDAWDHITANGGVGDKISVTLMGATTNELLFSSSWSSNATQAQTITGGNINVRNGSSSSSTSVNNSITKSGQMEVAVKEGAFVVKAYPNPTEHEFTLIVNSSLQEKIVIQLYDAVGRKIQTLSANANETIRFGEKLKTGVYIAKVIQGNRKESIKLIKQ